MPQKGRAVGSSKVGSAREACLAHPKRELRSRMLGHDPCRALGVAAQVGLFLRSRVGPCNLRPLWSAPWSLGATGSQSTQGLLPKRTEAAAQPFRLQAQGDLDELGLVEGHAWHSKPRPFVPHPSNFHTAVGLRSGTLRNPGSVCTELFRRPEPIPQWGLRTARSGRHSLS